MKICLVASRGGHLRELEFAKYLDKEVEMFLITEKSAEISDTSMPVYYVDQINRKEPLAIYKILKLFYVGNKILKKESPDCYISTGALISIPILLLGKLRGKKIIFVESFARVESASLSGKIAYKFADVFIVYWKNLLKIYPNAVYINLLTEQNHDFSSCWDTEISL